MWEERNAEALQRGEDALQSMLPLVRLKVKNKHEKYTNKVINASSGRHDRRLRNV